MDTFGERLKHVAKAQFGGVGNLAEAAGINPAQMSKYTSGKSEITTPVLMRLFNVGISIEWLLSGKGEMMQGPLPPAHGYPGELYLKMPDGRLVRYEATPNDDASGENSENPDQPKEEE